MRRRVRDWLLPRLTRLVNRWKTEQAIERGRVERSRLEAWNGNPDGDGQQIDGTTLAVVDGLRAPGRVAKRRAWDQEADSRRGRGVPEGSTLADAPQDLVGEPW